MNDTIFWSISPLRFDIFRVTKVTFFDLSIPWARLILMIFFIFPSVFSVSILMGSLVTFRFRFSFVSVFPCLFSVSILIFMFNYFFWLMLIFGITIICFFRFLLMTFVSMCSQLWILLFFTLIFRFLSSLNSVTSLPVTFWDMSPMLVFLLNSSLRSLLASSISRPLPFSFQRILSLFFLWWISFLSWLLFFSLQLFFLSRMISLLSFLALIIFSFWAFSLWSWWLLSSVMRLSLSLDLLTVFSFLLRDSSKIRLRGLLGWMGTISCWNTLDRLDLDISCWWIAG